MKISRINDFICVFLPSEISKRDSDYGGGETKNGGEKVVWNVLNK